MITNITPNFITVENENPNISDSDSEKIKVLERSQILPYQDMQYSQSQFSQTYPSHQSHPNYDPMYSHGNISVNPIIKIVNGDDKSSGAIDSGVSPTDQPQNTPINTPIIITKRDSESVNDSDNSSSSEPDFSKALIIKKMSDK